MPNQPQGEDHPNARLSMIHHHKRWAHVAEAVGRATPGPPRRIPESTKRRIAQMARTRLYREIGAQFGLSTGTVASIVARQREAGAA